ncbi:MAG TPA: CRTAC1 family protein [Acidimicrobiia bacterium]|nr:CRTAC1 family protein [Acidimicrobiia bacterium]
MTGRFGPVLWLVSGVMAGLAAAGALAVGVMEVVRGDAPTAAMAAPEFQSESGVIQHVYDGDFQFFVGGGVAVLDCDGNDLPDLFLAGGENPSGLYRNTGRPGGTLSFAVAGDSAATMTGVTGAYPLDVDSDGITDLAVLRVGGNVILRGVGDCGFEAANERWGIEGGNDWTVSFSATWEPGESWPTMVFGNYLDLDRRPEQTETCDDHHLLRPVGKGYGAPLTLRPGYCTLSVLFSDWDRSGRRDLRMTNDRHYYRDGTEQLWRMAPDDPPRPYGVADGWREMQIWGMGIASQELTGDGRPEIYLTSQGDNKLQTLADDSGRPTYEDIALPRGASAHRPFVGDNTRPSTAWHAEFDDLNNDGFMDLFVTKGNVEAMPEFASQDPNNLLLGQPGGTFVEAADAAGLIDVARSRGGAVADLNLDGLLDVVVVDRRENVKLWRQTGAAGNWLSIELDQPGANRDAVGAWIRLRLGNHLIERELTVGGGHAGGDSGSLHFGLGHATAADVQVVWPDGEVGDWRTLPANQHVTLTR